MNYFIKMLLYFILITLREFRLGFSFGGVFGKNHDKAFLCPQEDHAY